MSTLSPLGRDEIKTLEHEYRNALRTFDWSYEYSEDMDLWRRCKAKEAQLRVMQKAIDPTGEIWMHYRSGCGPLPTVQKEQANG